MLASENRLTKKTDFDLVKQKGKRFQGFLFGVVVYPTNNQISRFGFIVSNKISNKSAERNRIKRILREIVRKNIPKIKTGFDVLFLAKKELLRSSFSQVEDEVLRILEEAEVR